MLRAVADLLVPPRCAGCDRPADRPLCPPCAAALTACALPPIPEELAEGIRAVGGYRHEGAARSVLLAAKIRGRRAVLPVLAALLRARLALPPPRSDLAWTSVPPGRRTRRRHGVDVPAALAAPYGRRLLRADPRGGSQTGSTAASRRRRARHRYVALERVPPFVVLVDDVRTTGATAVAAGAALQAAGARRVLVVTFSVTPDPAAGPDPAASPAATGTLTPTARLRAPAAGAAP